MPPRKRKMNALDKALEAFAKTKVGGWYFVKVGNKIDRPVLKLSRGWFSFAVGSPVLLLKSTGAKSGLVRETPLVYTLDGEAIVLVASNAGSTKHPGWYANLSKNPACEVIAKRRSGRYIAREVTDPAERDRVWALVNDTYNGYEVYQGRTDGRLIPLMVLNRA
jgi:deazaflavin-dependent oxidoreductase (nitroreductase family)